MKTITIPAFWPDDFPASKILAEFSYSDDVDAIDAAINAEVPTQAVLDFMNQLAAEIDLAESRQDHGYGPQMSRTNRIELDHEVEGTL